MVNKVKDFEIQIQLDNFRDKRFCLDTLDVNFG